MSVWNYEVNGSKLRSLLDEDNYSGEHCAKCIIELRKVVKECLDMLKADDGGCVYDFENLYYLLDGDDELCMLDEVELKDDYGFDDAMSIVNDRVYEFWDLCDYARIWVKF